MRNISFAATIAALLATSACEKTGEGEYQVEQPVIGTETDTVRTPDIETGTARDTVDVPDVDVDVGTERREVDVPDVDVRTPGERDAEGR